MTKVLTTDLLKSVRKNAMRLRLPRSLHSRVVGQLDPKGVHVVLKGLTFLRDDDHVRMALYLKLNGVDEPLQAVQDATLDDFNRLPAIDDEGNLVKR